MIWLYGVYNASYIYKWGAGKVGCGNVVGEILCYCFADRVNRFFMLTVDTYDNAE